jgi:hypothetical protein
MRANRGSALGRRRDVVGCRSGGCRRKDTGMFEFRRAREIGGDVFTDWAGASPSCAIFRIEAHSGRRPVIEVEQSAESLTSLDPAVRVRRLGVLSISSFASP